MTDIKNALVLDGKTYIAKRASAAGIVVPDGCGKCDLRQRCIKSQSCFCAPFEKKGYVPYFKLVRK